MTTKSILIVEDSKSMRQMITMTLSTHYDVKGAEDGKQGLALASQEKFDLIISDVNMPNMNGIEMCVAVKSGTKNKQTPVIFLTTESGDEIKNKGKLAGAVGWIVKPFSPEKLLQTIQRVI